MLLEATFSGHFIDRVNSRLLRQDIVSVGYEIEGTRGQYKVVGTFKIPQEIKNQAGIVLNKIENQKFPMKQSYAVQVAYIQINPNQVNFTTGSLEECKGKTLIIVDEATQSNGNVIFAIIRTDNGISLYFAKSYVDNSPQKMDVNHVIKNIDKFNPR